MSDVCIWAADLVLYGKCTYTLLLFQISCLIPIL